MSFVLWNFDFAKDSGSPLSMKQIATVQWTIAMWYAFISRVLSNGTDVSPVIAVGIRTSQTFRALVIA